MNNGLLGGPSGTAGWTPSGSDSEHQAQQSRGCPQSHRSEMCMVPLGACAFPPHLEVHRPRRGLPDMALLCSLWGRAGFRPRLPQASWSNLSKPQPFPAAHDAELRTEWPVRSKMTAYEAVSNGFFFFSRSVHFSLVWFGGQGLTIQLG